MLAEDESGAAAEEGENYFVSMTDMMIGVLFVFLIMLMVFALDFRTQTDVQQGALEEARRLAASVRDLQAEIAAEIGAIDEAAEARRELLLDIKESLEARDIDVTISPRSDVLRIGERAVRFASGDPALRGEAAANVATIAGVLERALEPYVACRAESGTPACRETGRPSIETVFIEGHTDRTGVDRANWTLSAERAANTYQEMVRAAGGLTAYLNRTGEPVLSISGYASSRPIDRGDDENAFAQNRRIDLRFVMENDTRERIERLQRRTGELEGEIEALIRAIESEP
ncbi:OmpA/MotB family protein [Salinarimonas rosea]|uniref:OmpA/MotB family protein n=1 Tax=Salinarimonas rosea TaxID=552063 RepID=UPI00040BA4F0|nr:OmpA family protein [Salinarimonas rosea]